MKQYNVTGMSCAACSARVEKAVSAVEGVTSCSVSLLTNSMGVEGNASSEAIIAAVKNAGYGATAKGESNTSVSKEDELKDTETPKMKRRLIASIVFLLILMYISMGHTMLGAPLPSVMNGNHVMTALAELLLAAIVMVINQKFFINGFRGIVNRSPNMDTLVALGSGASFVYSTAVLFMMTAAQQRGDRAAVHAYMHDLYFESAAMILTLITVGKMLEARSKGKTTDALKSLMKLAPETAVVIRDGEEVIVPVEQVKKGEIFVVRAGDSIPVDGIVIEGESAVNEAALTGESIPVDKTAGDSVSAATINSSGYLRCEASRIGEDTTLSQIIKMVSDAAATKAPIAKIADKVSGVFVPVVIGIALLTLIVWLIIGRSVGFSLSRAIAVLVISCPCALGLATPVAIMVGNGVGAKNGLLFKTAASLEEAGKAQIIALDKTGTITSGEPKVTDIIPVKSHSEDELLRLAYSLEKKSEHPLAGAVVKYGNEKDIIADDITEFRVLAGSGVSGKCGESSCIGGNLSLISSSADLDENIISLSEKLSEQGKTPLFFAKNGELIGIIAVADVIKDESPKAIRELQDMGIHVVMLTGDNERTANAIGGQAGVDEVIAGVLPDGKEAVIRRLKKQGKTVMVGDGINDAPALTAADIGIAIGAGADVAIDAADIVLMKSRLSDVPAAVRLSRATLRNIRQNLFWAFIYNIIGIPLAAGVYSKLFGWQMNPMFGAAAMSLSSFFVVSNALRLNFFKVHDSSRDKKRINKLSEASSETSTVLIKINGMMCGHCEARVKKALEELPFIDEAAPSHEKGTAELSLSGVLDEKAVKKAVTDAGYKYIGIKQ
ncbi:heavy metal translocating P-type ATPase [Ruminococcus sp.]|uniref:heavy metal translocating P-type ATPase n=1 Tax=Ruminococcus sp. TaxID=41978 RepID=UPI0025F4BB9F|nr:heavy metal translocating P-type ATPase [Ruminococcus sp.]MCR4637813.1 heavy metal translocating P-type ATPase [Ruminococcus sp.]